MKLAPEATKRNACFRVNFLLKNQTKKCFSKFPDLKIKKKINCSSFLVGGVNPSWKICSSNWMISPGFGVKIPKIFELPPPSYCWGWNFFEGLPFWISSQSFPSWRVKGLPLVDQLPLQPGGYHGENPGKPVALAWKKPYNNHPIGNIYPPGN